MTILTSPSSACSLAASSAKPSAVCGTSCGCTTTDLLAPSTATILLPLETSTPTANMRNPPDVLLQWLSAFPIADSNCSHTRVTSMGSQPAQIERCTMGRLAG